jgi:hypothetical protein
MVGEQTYQVGARVQVCGPGGGGGRRRKRQLVDSASFCPARRGRGRPRSRHDMGNDEEENRPVAELPHHHSLPRRLPTWRKKVEALSTSSHTAPQHHLIASLVPMPSRSSAAAPNRILGGGSNLLLLNRRSTLRHPNCGRKKWTFRKGSGWRRGREDWEEGAGKFGPGKFGGRPGKFGGRRREGAARRGRAMVAAWPECGGAAEQPLTKETMRRRR